MRWLALHGIAERRHPGTGLISLTNHPLLDPLAARLQVKPARLHPRSIMAGGGMGSTGGVGEAAAEFVKQAAIDVVVLGSRGLGSIRRWVPAASTALPQPANPASCL
jgi:hypothetical protein